MSNPDNELRCLYSTRGSLPVLTMCEGQPLLVYCRQDDEGCTVCWRTMDSQEDHAISAEGIDCAELAASAGVAVWSQLLDGRYQLFAVDLPSGVPQQITAHPSSILSPALCLDAAGNPSVAYQAADEQGHYRIYLQRRICGVWLAPICMSDIPGDHRAPAITRCADGALAVAWDSNGSGTFDIYLRLLSSDDRLHEPVRLSGDGRYHANVSVAPAAGGGVIVAWNSGIHGWGQANEVYRISRMAERQYLHTLRHIEMAHVVANQVHPIIPEVQETLDRHLPGMLHERPRLLVDHDGAVLLALRYNEGQPNNGGRTPKRWQAAVLAHTSQGWSRPLILEQAYGVSTGAIAMLVHDGILYAAAAGEGGEHYDFHLQTSVHLYACSALDATPIPHESSMVEHTFPLPEAGLSTTSADRHAVALGDEQFTLFFGDIHRHTEFSACRTSVDGALHEAYRAMKSVVGLDFGMVADHDTQIAAPDLWRMGQQAADQHYIPGAFTTFFGCEWIGGHDNRRHRNIVSTRRLSPPPFEAIAGHRDVRDLWATLPEGQAITVPHHTACGMSLLWGKDPGEGQNASYEPLVEIFQASRASSEYPGCPTLFNAAVRIGLDKDFNVAGGFVSDALQQGYRLGFIASSDHMSIARSFACVYARENTREALMEAMRQRRVYAASARIICEFSIGDAFMGQATTLSAPTPARLYFRAAAPIDEVVLLRDSQPYRTWRPTGDEAWIEYPLTPEEANGHYFYARMRQHDSNLAWSSPIWVGCD